MMRWRYGKKAKNTLFSVLGIIALGVAISTFYKNSKQDEATERSLRFVNASVGEVGSEEKFLSFAEDYDDTLGGVAQYRAASIQYGEEGFQSLQIVFLSPQDDCPAILYRGVPRLGMRCLC